MNLFKNNKNILLILLICSQCIVIYYFFYNKIDLFIDEQWSFILSNSYYFPFIGDASNYFDRWLTNDFFYNHMVAMKEHLFSYDSVWYNQKNDVHPPLYYFILHTICSIFPLSYSKWFGFIPNIVCFIVSQIFLFKSANILFNDIDYNKKFIFSICVCIFFGFSLGCINTAIIIRMYMMLTMFTIAALYINLYIIKKCISHVCSCKKFFINCICLYFVYFLGILTQYLFAIPAFFISLMTLIIIFMYGYKKYILCYIASTCLGIISLFFVFPAAWGHIFGDGYRGEQMRKLIGSANVLDRIKEFTLILSSDIYIIPFVFIAIICIVFIIIKNIYKFDILFNNNGINIIINKRNVNITYYNFFISSGEIPFIITFISFLLSFFVLSRVTEIIDDRYIMHIYPLCILCICYILYKAINNLQKIKIFILIFLFLLFINKSILFVNPENTKWNQHHYKYAIELLQNNTVNTILYISNLKEWWPTVHAITKFIYAKNIFLITQNNLQNLPMLNNKDKYFMIVIDRFCDVKKVKKNIINKYNITNIKQIVNDWNGSMFLCEK